MVTGVSKVAVFIFKVEMARQIPSRSKQARSLPKDGGAVN